MRHVTNEHTPGTTGYDAELQRHDEVLRRAVRIQLYDHVLDIGCGTGQTTRQAARSARAGSALGVDVSAPAIKRARELARAEGLRNVTFEHADAQVHRFPQERFDLAVSRFGTMFFDDPVAAFTNIRRAVRPAGRLVMMVWQPRERNEWDVTIRQSLEAAVGPVAGASDGPDPFSLADPPAVQEILHAAGFADVNFTDVHERVYYGPDVDAALDWVRGFTCTAEILKGWIRRRQHAPSRICAWRLPRTSATTAFGSTPALGSSRHIATERDMVRMLCKRPRSVILNVGT